MKDAVSSLGSTQDEALDKLHQQNAMHDARLDLALDASSARSEAVEREAANEATLKQLKAQELIRQMKLEMGGGAKAASSSSKSTAAPDPMMPEDGLPEKTLGRMKPRGDDAS